MTRKQTRCTRQLYIKDVSGNVWKIHNMSGKFLVPPENISELVLLCLKTVGLTKEISEHRQSTNAESAECSSSWNVSVQLVNHGCLPMTSHYHLLFPQLLSHLL